MVVVIACHTVVSGEPFSDKEVVKIFPRFSLITFLIFFCVKELNAEYLQGKTHGDCHNLLILLGIVSREKIKLIRINLINVRSEIGRRSPSSREVDKAHETTGNYMRCKRKYKVDISVVNHKIRLNDCERVNVNNEAWRWYCLFQCSPIDPQYQWKKTQIEKMSQLRCPLHCFTSVSFKSELEWSAFVGFVILASHSVRVQIHCFSVRNSQQL